MTSRSLFIKHVFGGGWATDYGSTAFVGLSNGNSVTLPWLNEAENVTYELDGGPHKIPGATKNFDTALESGAAITGVYDAWFSGTSGTPSQHRILNAGTTIKNDSGDNTFVDLFTGMTAGAVPDYSMLEDLLVMANDSGVDVPKSWDGTTAQDLAGTPPTFAFSVSHGNKLWAAGVKSAPSRLYYSVDFKPDDWTNTGSGHIDIDPSDGDRITGLVSYRGDLWVFKGPYKGSIHRITGTSPSTFARVPFASGVGSVNHKSIVPYANDVAFVWSDGTVRALSTTANYGDFEESSLSEPINTWIRDHVTKAYLGTSWAANWPEYGIILFVFPIDGSLTPNCILMADYRFSPARWAKWPVFNMVQCLAQGVSFVGEMKRVILAGCSDGFLRTLGSSTRTLDTSTSIPFNVVTPYVDYDVPERMKTLEGAAVNFNPKSSGNVTFGWTNDAQAQQTVDIPQGGTNGVLDSFLLDTDRLGGGRFYESFSRLDEAGGEFRTIQFQILQNVSGIDVEVHSFSAHVTPSAQSFESA